MGAPNIFPKRLPTLLGTPYEERTDRYAQQIYKEEKAHTAQPAEKASGKKGSAANKTAMSCFL